MPLAPHTPAVAAQDHAALIVGLDAGDLAGAELRAAETLATTCAGCAALVEDLAAIRGAMTALPVLPRRRDYRLTIEDAARLRPSGWRRLLEWLAAPGSSVRPLATGFATLGLVGLLMTSGLPGLLSGFGSSAASPAMAPMGAQREKAAPQGAGGVDNPGNNFSPAAARTSAPANNSGPGATPSPGTALSAASAPPPAATSAPIPAASGPPPVPSAAPTDGQGFVAGDRATAAPTGERSGTAGTSDRGAGSTGGPESNQGAARDSTPALPLPLPLLVSLTLLAVGLALVAGRLLARRRLL